MADKVKIEKDKIYSFIRDIPCAKDVNDEKKIAETLNQLKKFEKDEFVKLLQKCHNIIRNNDKLSPEAAFDEISKISSYNRRFSASFSLLCFMRCSSKVMQPEPVQYASLNSALFNPAFLQSNLLMPSLNLLLLTHH